MRLQPRLLSTVGMERNLEAVRFQFLLLAPRVSAQLAVIAEQEVSAAEAAEVSAEVMVEATEADAVETAEASVEEATKARQK